MPGPPPKTLATHLGILCGPGTLGMPLPPTPQCRTLPHNPHNAQRHTQLAPIDRWHVAPRSAVCPTQRRLGLKTRPKCKPPLPGDVFGRGLLHFCDLHREPHASEARACGPQLSGAHAACWHSVQSKQWSHSCVCTSMNSENTDVREGKRRGSRRKDGGHQCRGHHPGRGQ